MIIELVKALIFILVLVCSFYFWNKSQDKGWLWFSWIGVVALILKLIDILFKNYLTLSDIWRFAFNIISITLNFILVALIILVLWKGFNHRNK